MRYYLDYQLADVDNGAWLDPANMKLFAQTCEAAGVGAIALTDHPAPSRKWLDAGGHDTLDPFAGLSFFAACTDTIRLMTYLTVVPYRNPFLLAKAMTTVDVVSGGRATFTLGTGYLRSEFAALGVDMDQRNGLFDEAMEVVRGLLASPHEFHHEGSHFKALGVTMSPPPIQAPHPPLWLGGNAKVVRDRVAQWGNGWAPLTLGGSISGKVSRTAPIPDLAHFTRQIGEIKEHMDSLGRDPESLDVAAPGIRMLKATDSMDQKHTHVAELVEAGVTWTSVPYDKVNFKQALEDIAAFGEDVITGALD
ncbi:putative F420-dependent oxidoreductase [Nocardioides ginsengisegetis]|uniref:Putative F420-dependent oxidoreductase n=1 Tax=Nocardioides ginsengisegetis TaxID=661491 RepID=A0A7W3J2A2_9ACTN|nr:TIGR03619 family F420-dependent LLM class oxidoreductase [Nocardioides ginsengisegetis]MBA8804962.1 putative F420-dependent oxidoreductase [Nocardioides ginsengisegetis]